MTLTIRRMKLATYQATVLMKKTRRSPATTIREPHSIPNWNERVADEKSTSTRDS